ncbi:MAG: BTAD domain-containing putative transcriptional regulator [Caldilineaceae bacterium]
MPLTALHTARLQSLLAYLVLETAYPHSRAQLAALFWPDEAEAVARQNLRQALYQLRQLLDKPNAAAPPYLLLTHEQVQFNPAADYETDVATFLQRLAHGEARAAIDLYVDDLLPELHSVSDRFDEWLVWRREGLHIRAMATLDQLTTRALDQQQFAEAAVYARRQLTFEPWLEPAHRQLMLALAHKGDRHEALAQFEQCVQLLQRELGVTPDQATVTLATQIRAGTFATAPQAALPSHAPQPTTAPPATPPEPTLPQPAKIDWGEAPEITALHGREAEMQLLTRWLVTDQCRLVAVVGMGGMGKTTLAASTVHQVAEHFDVVIWRSLLNAPQPEEMIRSWLRLLDEAQTTQAAQDFDTALAQLFTQLQGRRCLLILDNVESLLQSDDRAGHYRSGYAAYGQLFKRFGETSHRSTLFLTSREAPQEVVRLARERPTVQSLALVGLRCQRAEQFCGARASQYVMDR